MNEDQSKNVPSPNIQRRRHEAERPRSNSQTSQETASPHENFRVLSRNHTWTSSHDASQSRLNRHNSASLLFHREVDISAADIISALAALDFSSDYVKALTRTSPGIYAVTFYDLEDKDAFLQLTDFAVNNFKPLLQDSIAPLTFVNIRNASPELPDAAVIARLKCYGDVITFRRCTHYDTEIENGIRTARMRLRSPIPSFIRIASESLLILYNNQPRTCRKCNRTGHEARTCTVFACFNCDAVGHVASSCAQPTRCSICKCTAHKAYSCPYAVIDDLDTTLPINTVLAEALSAVAVIPTPATSAAPSDSEQEEHEINDAESLAVRLPALKPPSNSDNSNTSTVISTDIPSLQLNPAQLPATNPPEQSKPDPKSSAPSDQIQKTTSKPPPVPLPPKPPVEDDNEEKMSVCSASSKRNRPEDPESDEEEDHVAGGPRRKTKPQRPHSGKPNAKHKCSSLPKHR